MAKKKPAKIATMSDGLEGEELVLDDDDTEVTSVEGEYLEAASSEEVTIVDDEVALMNIDSGALLTKEPESIPGIVEIQCPFNENLTIRRLPKKVGNRIEIPGVYATAEEVRTKKFTE